jgi:hypothetical protein
VRVRIITDRTIKPWYRFLRCMGMTPAEGLMAIHISWRNFVTTLGGTVTWAVAAYTQQPVMSIIALLRNTLWRGAR